MGQNDNKQDETEIVMCMRCHGRGKVKVIVGFSGAWEEIAKASWDTAERNAPSSSRFLGDVTCTLCRGAGKFTVKKKPAQ